MPGQNDMDTVKQMDRRNNGKSCCGGRLLGWLFTALLLLWFLGWLAG